MAPLLIVEGAELVGKSYAISQIYARLEGAFHESPHRLDGCHWFNCDIGLFGGPYGRLSIEHYLAMAEAITDRPIIFEKFHLSDIVYHLLYEKRKIRYTDIEERLLARGARLIHCMTNPDPELFRARLEDRVRLYPHYRRIAKEPSFYVQQLEIYRDIIAESKLPRLAVDTSKLPNTAIADEIYEWIQHA